MSPFPHLSKAPIVEAVIELRVAAERPAEVASLEEAVKPLGGEFPVKQKIRHLTSTLVFGSDGQAEQQNSATPVGVRVESADHLQVVQFRPDLMAVSLVRRYSRWDELVVLTERVWTSFAKAVSPKVVHRLGVRFINRIEVRDGQDIDQILTAGPRVPNGLPQSISEFSTRILVPMAEQDCFVTVSQSLDNRPPGTEASTSAIMIDIDAFSEVSLAADWRIIGQRLECLRLAKNMAFFSCLRPGVLETLK